MRRYGLSLLALTLTLVAYGAGDRKRPVGLSISAKDEPAEWLLGLIDGKLMFEGQLGNEVKDEPNMPSIPHDPSGMRMAFRWMRNGDADTLQIHVDRDQQAEAPSQREKNDWYLTAEYTDKGAQVVLTKEATKYSHWKFVDENLDFGADVPQYHIRNINDLGKEAWLGVDSKGTRYIGRQELRKPILTSEKKFYVGVERIGRS